MRTIKKIVSCLTLLFVIVPAFSAQGISSPYSWDITSDYGPRNYPTSFFHKGIDYGGPEGADIRAVEGGTIETINYDGAWYIKINSDVNRRWSYLHIFSSWIIGTVLFSLYTLGLNA